MKKKYDSIIIDKAYHVGNFPKWYLKSGNGINFFLDLPSVLLDRMRNLRDLQNKIQLETYGGYRGYRDYNSVARIIKRATKRKCAFYKKKYPGIHMLSWDPGVPPVKPMHPKKRIGDVPYRFDWKKEDRIIFGRVKYLTGIPLGTLIIQAIVEYFKAMERHGEKNNKRNK